MIKSLIDFFVSYARETSVGRMIWQVFVFLLMATWLAVITIVATNFSTIYGMYDRYQAQQNIQIESALESSKRVQDLLNDQRVRLDVDRLFVSRFHNGKVDLNGIHFIFFSRVSESTGSGISNELTQTQNLPLAIFPEMLAPLSTGQCYYVEEVEPSVENSTFLGQMGVKSRMVCPIHNIDGRLIGIIGADGVVDQINTADAMVLESSLETLSGVLGGLLGTQ